MNLGDLVDELRTNILYDRSNRVAGGDDQLWSTKTLVRYIDEAHKRFARQALVIRDGSTPEVCRITLRAGVDQYPLHPSVIAVMSARHEDDSRDLVRAGHSVLDGYRGIASPPYFDPAGYEALPPGKPIAISTDEQVRADDAGTMSVVSLRVYPKPDAAQAGKKLQLRVVRGPLDAFSETNLSAVPEIPEAHHLEMLDWAAYLALRVADVDAGMPRRAQDFATSFGMHVREARRLALKKLFSPMGWGFGGHGFSWER